MIEVIPVENKLFNFRVLAQNVMKHTKFEFLQQTFKNEI